MFRDTVADQARERLLDDQHFRPIAEQRQQLGILHRRLERAGREALVGLLAARVKADPRYMPVLQRLLRIPER